jgi:hypothetical protein
MDKTHIPTDAKIAVICKLPQSEDDMSGNSDFAQRSG